MTLRRSVLLGAALVALAYAHGGHHTPVNVVEEKKKPVDAALWIHIALEATAWAVLFPLAMVLGLVRHKLHVPLSIAALGVAFTGYFFGSHHGGRQFTHTVHGTTASLLFVVLLVQAVCGVYLKLHLSWRPEQYIRPVVLRVHGFLGRAFPIIGWTQMVFGIATLQSWCNGGHLGQCLAHYIMGSAFAAYSVILLIMLKCAVEWLRRRGVSQEYLDSWVILLWGIVNTFTEHHGGPWTHKDLQHTLMGVLWWAGGAVGVWLSRKGKRTIFPAIIIAMTGWGMSGHAQALVRCATHTDDFHTYPWPVWLRADGRRHLPHHRDLLRAARPAHRRGAAGERGHDLVQDPRIPVHASFPPCRLGHPLYECDRRGNALGRCQGRRPRHLGPD